MQFVRRYTDAICSLMKSIFPVDKVKNLANTDAITGRDDCSFIKLEFINRERFLRAHKERVPPARNGFVCIATTCSDG